MEIVFDEIDKTNKNKEINRREQKKTYSQNQTM